MPCKIVRGTKSPGNESSSEQKVQGTKVPRNFRSPGTNVPENEKSQYPCTLRTRPSCILHRSTIDRTVVYMTVVYLTDTTVVPAYYGHDCRVYATDPLQTRPSCMCSTRPPQDGVTHQPFCPVICVSVAGRWSLPWSYRGWTTVMRHWLVFRPTCLKMICNDSWLSK